MPIVYSLPGTFHWSQEDKGKLISIKSQSLIAYLGDYKLSNIIRTTEAIPKTSSMFYFEIKIRDCGTNSVLGIGLTQADPNTRSGCFPGWKRYTTLGIGYHGDDGGIYRQSNKAIERTETFTTGDVAGCFMCQTRIKEEEVTLVQFTKNGQKFLSPRIIENSEWYPTIGMASPGASISTNFGEGPFVYDPIGI